MTTVTSSNAPTKRLDESSAAARDVDEVDLQRPRTQSARRDQRHQFLAAARAELGEGGQADRGGGTGGTQANEERFNPALIQDPNSIYGKVMRVDLSASFPTPASDATHPGIDVLALGIRNPFRSSFDRATGDFYFGDVGFTSREEIDFIPASHMASPGTAPLLISAGLSQRE